MPAARFCPACGTRAHAGARFCADCGAPLDGSAGPPAAVPAGLRLNPAGLGVLGGFLVVGLGIWTTILSPAPIKPPLGASAAPAAQNAPPAGAGASGEARKMIDDLNRKAKDNPKDVEAWNKLGLVYVLAAQRDPTFYPQARSAFEHVLELDPKQSVALRGMANVHHGRGEYRKAIEFYDRYLAVQPADDGVRTEMGTAHLSAGDIPKARSIFEAVLAKTPNHLEAQYFLGKALLQQGDETAALAALRKARTITTDDDARRQIDTDIASITGEAVPPKAPLAPGVAASTPLQRDVEQALKSAPIMGERLDRFEWTAPTQGRAVVKQFPMAGMPAEVREKFLARMEDQLRAAAQRANHTGPLQIEIVDATSMDVMATLSTSPQAAPPTGAPAAANPALSAFQSDVEAAFRGAPIMGERIAGIEWTGASAARIRVQNFPMAGMPEAVREKFTTRLTDALKELAGRHTASGVRVDLVDQESGAVMATITP
jgi:cytochrome c-type biogenesis protein CcmH/NrfG